jgi:hypothetical protein
MTDATATTLPPWAAAQPRPARQAIEFLLCLMDAAPGVPVALAALHNPGTDRERFERLGQLGALDGPDDMLRMLSICRGANTKGNANIFVRPDPTAAHPWLFLDDVPLACLESLLTAFAGLAVQTSPDQGQARLLAVCSMDCASRTDAQRVLAERLGADLASVAGDKWGRLPGFTNT